MTKKYARSRRLIKQSRLTASGNYLSWWRLHSYFTLSASCQPNRPRVSKLPTFLSRKTSMAAHRKLSNAITAHGELLTIMSPSWAVDCSHSPPWAVDCYYSPSWAHVFLEGVTILNASILPQSTIPTTCLNSSAAAPGDLHRVTGEKRYYQVRLIRVFILPLIRRNF